MTDAGCMHTVLLRADMTGPAARSVLTYGTGSGTIPILKIVLWPCIVSRNGLLALQETPGRVSIQLSLFLNIDQYIMSITLNA